MDIVHRLARGLSTRLRTPAWLRLLALTVAVSLPLAGQAQTTGSVSGTVISGATSNFIEGADVSIDALNLRTNTGRGGAFRFDNVPAGSHSVSISYPGLTPYSTTVEVTAGATATIAATLSSDVVTLSEFKVTAMREGMAQAMALQRVSVQMKTVLAADQFGPISEGNVGEYMKFIPGVSVDYNVNDARGVSLRGLSTAFTIVTVDGTPMAGASSVDLTRRFEFEQIAMNNVETTELFKTVTPDISAGATGGFVNFVTKSAFDHGDKQRISYDLSFGGPSTNFELKKVGGVWGNRKEFPVRPSLEANISRKLSDKVGINVNYRFSDKYDDAPRTIENWTISGTTPTLGSYTVQDEQKLTHRESLAAKVDFRFSDQTKVFVAGSWNNYDLLFTQRGIVFNLGSNSTLSGDTVTSGTSGTRTITNNILQRRKFGDTYHFNATLEHKFNDEAVIRITPYWSRADGHYQDTGEGYISGNAAITYGGTVPAGGTASPFNQIVLGGIYDITSAPSVILRNGATITANDYLRDLGNYNYNNSATGTAFQSRPWDARDIKSGVNGNYTRDLTIGSIPVSLDAGFAMDDVNRRIKKPDYRAAQAVITGNALRSLADEYYSDDVAFGFGSMQAIDPYKLWSAYSSTAMVLNNYENYRFEEENLAGYLRLDAKVSDKLLLVGGVRWEQRDITAETERFSGGRSNTGLTTLKYDNFFPSLTFKYSPSKSLVFRGGASRTVGHPDYTDLVTSVTPETTSGGDGIIVLSDPNLKPYFASNFDLGVDYFTGTRGVIGVAVFYKKLNNFISQRSMSVAERNAAATALGYDPLDFSTGTISTNGAAATYQGVEFSFAQNLTFLPKPFDGLSVQANYSYVDISSDDLDTEYSAKRAVSPQTINVILGYRLGRFNATITNNWVDENLYGGFVNTSYFAGTGDNRLLRMKDEKWTTDAKVEYSINKYVSAYAVVRNIFNSGREEYFQGYIPSKRDIILPMRYGEFGEPSITFGIRGTF